MGFAVLPFHAEPQNLFCKCQKRNTDRGTAKFTQNGNEVTMKLDITNLTPGIHAVHIHEKETAQLQTELLLAATGILRRMIMVNGVPNISIWEI